MFTFTFESIEPCRTDKFHKFIAICANCGSRKSALIIKQLKSSNARVACFSS